MIDSHKRQALIDWVNIMLNNECIESLAELKDGIHFCKLVHALDQDQDTVLNTAQDRFSMVALAIDNLCQVSVEDKIDVRRIIDEGNEFEIAKICLLLLCAGVFSQEGFKKAAMTLDQNTQLEIYDMLEPVLKPQSESVKLVVFEDNVGSVLQKQRSPSEFRLQTPISSAPQEEDDGSRLMQTSALDMSQPCTTFYSSPSVLTPLQQMVASPVMTTKIKLQQQDQHIKRLIRELNAERYARDELEIEIREYERKDQTIKDLQQQLRITKRQLSELQLCHESQMSVQEEDTINPMKRRLMELSKEAHELKDCRRFLEICNDQLTQEIELLTEKFNRLHTCHKECYLQKESLIRAEQSLCGLRMTLHDTNCQVSSLMEANHKMELELRDRQELCIQHQERLQQVMETDRHLQEQIALLDSEQREKNKWKQETQDLQVRYDDVNAQHEELHQHFQLDNKRLSEMCEKLTLELSAVGELCRYEEAETQKLKNQLSEVESRNEEKMHALEKESSKQNQERFNQVMETNRRLNEKIALMECEQREENKWQQDLEDVSDNLNGHCDELPQQYKETEKQTIENQLTEVQITNEKKVLALEKQLQHQQVSHENKVSDLIFQLKHIQELNYSLISELEVVKQSNCDLETVLSHERHEMNTLLTKYNNVEQELDNARHRNLTEIAQLNDKIKNSKFELCHTKQAKSKLEMIAAKEMSQLTEKLDKMEYALENKEKDKCELETLLSNESSMTVQWQSRCRDLEEEMIVGKDSYQTELCKLNEKVRFLELEILDVDEAKNKVHKLLLEYQQRLQAKDGDFERKLNHIKQRYQSQVLKLESELQVVQEKNSSLQHDVNNFRAKLEEMESALRQTKPNYDKAVEALKDQVRAAESKNMELEQAVLSYKATNESFAANQQEHFQKVMLMEEAIKQSKRALMLNQQHQEEMLEAEFKVHLALVEKEKEKLVEENEELKDRLSDLEQQLEAYKQDLERVQKESYTKMVIFEGEKRLQKADMYEKQLSFQDSLDELRHSNKSQQYNIEQFKSWNHILEDQLSKAGDELSTLKEDYNSALQRTDALISELYNEKESHEKTRSHLQNEQAIALQSHTEALEQIDQLIMTRDEMVSQLDEEVMQRRELQSKLHHTESEVTELQSCLHQLEEIHHKLDEAFKTQQSEAEANEIFYKMQLEKMEKECHNLKQEMNELKVQHENDILQCKELASAFHQQCQAKKEQLLEKEEQLVREQTHLNARQMSDKATPTTLFIEAEPLETSFSLNPSKNKRSRVCSSILSPFDVEMKGKLRRDKCGGSSFSLASSDLSFELKVVTPHHQYNTRSRTSLSGLTKDNQKSPKSVSSEEDHYEESKEKCNLRCVIGLTEDEPEQVDFSCVSELQRRNTCLPHIKFSYPVTPQTFEQRKRLLRKRSSTTNLECTSDSEAENLKCSGSLNRHCIKQKPLITSQERALATSGVTPARTTPRRKNIGIKLYQHIRQFGLLKHKIAPHKSSKP